MADRSVKNGIMTIEDARAAGRAARLAGEPRSACPLRAYPAKAGSRAWLEGWDAAGPVAVKTRPVDVTTPELAIATRHFWPEGEALPEAFDPRLEQPCPACRRVRLATEARAVVARGIHAGGADLLCRGCGHRFSMKVRTS